MMVQWLHLCHHHIRCHPPVARSSDDDRNPDVCCRCCCLLLSPASHSSPGSHFRCLIPEYWSSSGLRPRDWKIVRMLFVCFHCSEPGHYLCQDIILCAVLCWAQRIQSHAIIRTFVSMAKSSCFLRTQFYCLQSSNLKCDRKKSRLPERQLLFDGEDLTFLSFCFRSNVCDLVSKVIKIMRMGALSHW